MYRTNQFLNGSSLEITLTVPLKRTDISDVFLTWMTSLGGLGCILMNGGRGGASDKSPRSHRWKHGGGLFNKEGATHRGTFFYKYRGGDPKIKVFGGCTIIHLVFHIHSKHNPGIRSILFFVPLTTILSPFLILLLFYLLQYLSLIFSFVFRFLIKCYSLNPSLSLFLYFRDINSKTNTWSIFYQIFRQL